MSMAKLNDFLKTLPAFQREQASGVLNKVTLRGFGDNVTTETRAEKIMKAIELEAVFSVDNDGDYVFNVPGNTKAVITKTEYDFAVFCGAHTDSRHIGLDERRRKYERFRADNPTLTLREVRHLIDEASENEAYWMEICRLINEFE